MIFRELQAAQRPMRMDSMPLPQRGIPRRLFSFNDSDISAYETPNTRNASSSVGQYATPLDTTTDFIWATPALTRTHSTPAFRGAVLERIPESAEPVYDMGESALRTRRLNRESDNNVTFHPTNPFTPEARRTEPLDLNNDPEYQKALDTLKRHGFNVSIAPVDRSIMPPANLDSTGASSYTLHSSSVNSRSVDTTNTGSESSQFDSSYVSVTSADIDRARRVLEANNLELIPMTSGSNAKSSDELGAKPKLPPRGPPKTNKEGIIVGPPGRTPAPKPVQRERFPLATIMSPVESERSSSSGGQQASRDGNERNRDKVRFSE